MLRPPFAVCAYLLSYLLCGCSPSADLAPPAIVSTDADLRIVSLAPHLTELVYSAGAGEHLVGAVAYSDFPEAAQSVAQIGDAFAVDFERLAELAPTLILAWEGGNPVALINSLREKGYRVEAFATRRLDDVATNLRQIGRYTGREAGADAAASAFEAGLADLSARHLNAKKLGTFFQISEHPVYTVSDHHLIGHVIELCGGINVFGQLDSLAANVTDEAVVAADAEVMLTTGPLTSLNRWSRFAGRAIRHGTRYSIPADSITRDSLRVLDGARSVCEALDHARAKLGRPATN